MNNFNDFLFYKSKYYIFKGLNIVCFLFIIDKKSKFILLKNIPKSLI